MEEKEPIPLRKRLKVRELVDFIREKLQLSSLPAIRKNILIPAKRRKETFTETSLQFGERNRTVKEISHYKLPSFDLYKDMSSVHGPFIEVAGPTTYGYRFIDTDKLPKHIHVSNVEPRLPQWHDITGEFIGYMGKLNFQADMTRLPIADQSIGVICVSCAQDPLVEPFLQEAERTLEENGLLIWQAARYDAFELAEKYGFEIVEVSHYQVFHTEDNSSFYGYNVILKKKNPADKS